MADRYWVGGTGTWNSSNTTNWSATSGGSGGASVPTSADNVLFDDNSAAGNFTVTVVGVANCLNFQGLVSSTKVLTLTGDTNSAINTYGTSFQTTTNAATSVSSFDGFLNVYGNICVITGNTQVKNISVKAGAVARLSYSVNTITGVLEIQQSSTCQIYNSYTCGVFRAAEGSGTFTTATLSLGWSSNPNVLLTCKTEISGYFQVFGFSTNSYLVANPSGTLVSLSLGQRLGNLPAVIPKLVLQPNASTNIFRFDISFEISLLDNTSSPCILEFSPSALKLQIGTFAINGTSVTKTKIQSTVSGVRANLTRPAGSTGLVETNYVEVKDMQPSPDNSWISYNSTNAGNNFQWYFDNFNKPTSNLFFGSHV